MAPSDDNIPTAIDVFCGAGLWSYAAQREGVIPIAGIDHDAAACASYQANHPHARCIHADVREVDFRVFTGVDLVLGSPPCITYSCGAGTRRSDSDEALHFARAVADIRPRAFILENVPDFARFSSFRRMMRQFDDCFTYVHVLNAADFGVPQRRRRMFVVGARTPIPFALVASRPPPSIGAILDPTAPMRPIESLSPGTRARIAAIPAIRFILLYYSQDFRGWQSLDAPLRTVTTVNKFLLTDKRSGTARMLTEHELRRAMAIPDSYTFCGSQRSRLRQIGNAVVPPVARFVLRSALAAFRPCIAGVDVSPA